MIIELTASTNAPIEQVGGKAQGLVRLIAAGLPVPQAWAIPASVSTDAVQRASLLDAELSAWWQSRTAQFPNGLWAVRSSAVAEDLADASFAGVYQTILGVDSFDALKAAVTQCWDALQDARAVAYRDKTGISEQGGIALVLQRMLQPQAAGVMLTANPQRPFAGEIVIDAAWGLGEAVVSGHTQPDHIVLKRNTGELIEEHIGDKTVETVWDSACITREVEPERRAMRSLDDDGLRSLHGIAVEVGKRIGPRRDLEWAIESGRVYVLQDRPITGLPSNKPGNIWSRGYGDEYLAEYSLPLPTDLCLHWISDAFAEQTVMQGRPDVAKMQSTCIHNGYSYISGNYLRELVRGVPASAREQVLRWFPGDFQRQLASVPFESKLVLKGLGAPAKDKGRGKIGENIGALARHCAEVEQIVLPWLAQDYTALSADALRHQCAEIERLGVQHFRVIRWGMGTYNPILHSLLSKLLGKWCKDESLYGAIISGLPGTHTAMINREVWQLGVLARADASLAARFRASDDFISLRDALPQAPFWTAFDTFIATHGHRAATRDISQPRWRETPEAILALIAAQVRAPQVGENPAEVEHRATARRLEAEATALKSVGPLRRAALRKLIKLTQDYTVYRENQRYHLDYIAFHLRRLMLEYGRRLAEGGVVADAWDVFLLHGPEFWPLTEGATPPADLRARIDARRAHWLRYRDRRTAMWLFDDVEIDEDALADGPVQVANGGDLRGLGAARGVASGRTRVVHSLADLAQVSRGDILVAGNIDPGWTSVFPLIHGLITETGGILSHGAILAREYGIPTVTGVKNVTTLLPTGTQVEIDGSAGTIALTATAESEEARAAA
ncbi:PEP/pyruvate-binding domain-containing protein [Lysobacter fragariae]